MFPSFSILFGAAKVGELLLQVNQGAQIAGNHGITDIESFLNDGACSRFSTNYLVLRSQTP